MNGGIAPFLLLAGTIGLLLGLAPWRRALAGGVVFVGAALLGFMVHAHMMLGVVFTGLFLSMILVAVLVYYPARLWAMWVVPISINCGLWLGTCAALTSTSTGLALGLLATLLAIPVHWIARQKFVILIKVVASWMIAIASLSLFVSLMPTPGYKLDHME